MLELGTGVRFSTWDSWARRTSAADLSTRCPCDVIRSQLQAHGEGMTPLASLTSLFVHLVRLNPQHLFTQYVLAGGLDARTPPAFPLSSLSLLSLLVSSAHFPSSPPPASPYNTAGNKQLWAPRH